MRRWNGWGDESVAVAAPASMGALLGGLLGSSSTPVDVNLAGVVATVPASRLSPHPLVGTDPAERVRHARGQSLPDLIALRGGHGLVFPDGVAFPISGAEVDELLRYARTTGAAIIPYGAGTSVVGHVNVPRHIGDERPVLTVDLSGLAALESLDETNRFATLGAGVPGRRLDQLLRPYGYTLGHFPQSYEQSSLGGWIATRSRGQQALLYGGIDTLLAGAEVHTPRGVLRLPPFVASSAGPDLRHVVLGSEGRVGIITSATVRVSPLPTHEQFRAVFFASWPAGVAGVRALGQAGLPGVSMLRLSDATETAITASMAGAEGTELLAALGRRGLGKGLCILVLGVSGDERGPGWLSDAVAMAGEHGGVSLPDDRFGPRWAAGRFQAPYLRNALWEQGYAVDTVETSAVWTHVDTTRTAIEQSLAGALAAVGERVVPFTHLSHVYPNGSSIYTTFLFRVGPDPAATLDRWQRLKEAVSRAIVAAGGTISHQHGVGLDHQPYLEAEKGALGLGVLRALAADLDPDGILNPGKLVS